MNDLKTSDVADRCYHVLANWLPVRAGCPIPKKIEGLSRTDPPDVDGKPSGLVPDFKITRYELGILAKHHLDELMSLRRRNDLWWNAGDAEVSFAMFTQTRLTTIETLLGADDYKAAISETEQQWNRTFTELVEEKKACRNNHVPTDDRPHMHCYREVASEISPLAAALPGLTRKQAQLIFSRKPFIGMTHKQASYAFWGLGHRHSSNETYHAGQWKWEVNKSAWGTDKRWLLTFHDGRLVEIDDIPRQESNNPGPISISREQTEELRNSRKKRGG